MRKFNHTNIIEAIVNIVYIAGFLAMFTFTINALITNM